MARMTRTERSVGSFARLGCAALLALPGTGSLVAGAVTDGPAGPMWVHGTASVLAGAVLALGIANPSRRLLGLVGLAAVANLPVQAFAFSLAGVAVPGAQTGLWMVAGFIWTGQWLGRRTCIWFALPSAAAYSSTVGLSPGTTRSDWASAALVWVVAFGVGMTSAAVQDRLRTQRRLARRRGELLELVVAATRDLIVDDPALALRVCAESVRRLGFGDVRITVTDDAGGSLDHAVGERIDPPAGLADDGGARLVEVAERLVACVAIAGPPGSSGRLLARATVRDASLDDHELEALELLASQLGHAIELARNVQRDRLSLAALTEASRRDPLTALGNRRAAEELIDSLRPGDVVVVADLDHFKSVNDRFGHAAGDDVLGRFAAHLRASLRPTDSAARWGGEEFLIVLRSAGQSSAAILDRLLHDWLDTAPRATFSAGYAIHGEGDAGRTTFEAADRALYEAKRGGRARVCPASRHPGQRRGSGAPAGVATTLRRSVRGAR